ncbi:MAG: hypothetical protein E7016_07795 [Alphaproteobacteria bacterium]|nr:hypothetical protein [Alphaproteobacteria bacterium]
MINCDKQRQAIEFMDKLVSDFSDSRKCFIVVSHLVDNTVDFLNTLSTKGRVAGLIAKPNSIDERAKIRALQSGINILDLKRTDFLINSTVSHKITPLIHEGEKLIIIDTGGYFAPSLKKLNQYPQIMGIVEDTENGLQKYEQKLSEYPDNKLPVFSVARSRAKDFEDYLIGRSIASATKQLLAENRVMLRNKKIGVIGFGEVGRGCAFYLKECLKLDVQIFDSNNNVKQLIEASGFKYSSKTNILESSDILICATGNKSLSDNDFPDIKKGCYIASCTSSEDEFNFSSIRLNQLPDNNNKIYPVQQVNFLNKGNAINFVYPNLCNEMLSPYIYLTFSSLLKCVSKLEKENNISSTKINTLTKQEEKELITDFLSTIKAENNNKNDLFIQQIRKSKIWGGL